MFERAQVIPLIGIVLVPAANYYLPYAPEIIASALAIAFIRSKSSRPLVELGLTPPPNVLRALVVGFAGGVALFALSRLVLTPWIEHATGTSRDLGSFDRMRGDLHAVLALLPRVWVMAALCEEVIYRGFIVTQAAQLMGGSRVALSVAVLVSAALFGLAHAYQGTTGMLLTGVFGVLLGLLFLHQRMNLWANVVAHGTADTASLIFIFTSWDRSLDELGRNLWFGS